MSVGRISLRLRQWPMLVFWLLFVLLGMTGKILLPTRLLRWLLQLRVMMMILVLPMIMIILVNWVQMKVMSRKVLLLAGTLALTLRLRLIPILLLMRYLDVVQLLLTVRLMLVILRSLLTLSLLVVMSLLPQLLNVVVQLYEARRQAGAIFIRLDASCLLTGAPLELLAQLRTAVLEQLACGAVADQTEATAQTQRRVAWLR